MNVTANADKKSNILIIYTAKLKTTVHDQHHSAGWQTIDKGNKRVRYSILRHPTNCGLQIHHQAAWLTESSRNVSLAIRVVDLLRLS
jgi:hypothetical protein